MNRRGFLQSILAAGIAPYVVTTAGVLMPGKGIVLPEWGISRVAMPDVVEGQAAQNMIYRLWLGVPLGELIVTGLAPVGRSLQHIDFPSRAERDAYSAALLTRVR